MRASIYLLSILLTVLILGQVVLSEDKPAHTSRLIYEYTRSENNIETYIWDIAASPDGKNIAIAVGPYAKGRVELRDKHDGKLLWSGDHPNGQAFVLTFSPDGTKLASAGFNQRGKTRGEVRLWDVASGRLLKTLSVYTGNVYSAAFSPDNCTIAVGSGDGRIRFWDSRSNKISQNALVGGFVTSLSFTSDGALLAFANWSQGRSQGGLWNVKARKLWKQLQNTDASVCSVAISPNGQTIATAAPIRVLSLRDNELLWKRDVSYGFEPIWHTYKGTLSFSPDSSAIAISGIEGAGIFKSSDGTTIKEYPKVWNLIISSKGEIFGLEYEGSTRGYFYRLIELDDADGNDVNSPKRAKHADQLD